MLNHLLTSVTVPVYMMLKTSVFALSLGALLLAFIGFIARPSRRGSIEPVASGASSDARRMTGRTKLVIGVTAFLLISGIAAGVLLVKNQDAIVHMVRLAMVTRAPQTAIPFALHEIDPARAGDCKAAADLDGDGFPDLILGGMPEEKLNWYRYPNWERSEIAVPSIEFTTDCGVGDIDGDGDMDIIVPDGNQGDNLMWFENPLPSAEPGGNHPWQRNPIGTLPSWVKDVDVLDFDGDGRLDVAARTENELAVFFQDEGGWTPVWLEQINLGIEGMTAGDIDLDGDPDLVLRGVWVRNAGGAAARNPGGWTQHSIGQVDGAFKALVVDLNQDGKQDVLFSSSEWIAPVDWWTPAGNDPTGPWMRHNIVDELDRAHTLQAGDIDLDGDVDVILAQMHTSVATEIFIMLNVDGQATRLEKRLIGIGGLHNGVLADIGTDGDLDLYGSNWTGNPPVRLWENQLNPDTTETLDLNRWTYKLVTSNHAQTFGLAFGDVDADGALDIISGEYWYANPGADMLGEWKQSAFPAGMHAILGLDVDGDSLSDVVAQRGGGILGLYWLEATTPDAAGWDIHCIGEVEPASHELGAQGVRLAEFTPGKSSVLISSGNGIYAFEAPQDHPEELWPRLHISSTASDEGFAVGDIDGDGDLDMAATTGDDMTVEWYENPGDGSELWPVHHIANIPEIVFPDRTELADFNQDGRLDVLVTEENGEGVDAETYWWEQPAAAGGDGWVRHPITSQGSTNSADVADMDGDGDTDVILAEHRGDNRLSIWVNEDHGNFSEQEISRDRESHLGARTADLDGDGDLDIVSIAWDAYQSIHLWRNDAISPADPQ